MTDRGRDALRQSQNQIDIGPSSARWEDGALVFQIDEVSTPHAQRIKGTVRVIPSAVTDREVPLKSDGTHIWRPFAPTCRIHVELNRRNWSWSGHGYFDANFGTRALEDDFNYWTWARMPRRDGTSCFYDVETREGARVSAALHIKKNGDIAFFDPPPKQKMRRSLWLLRREGRSDSRHPPRQVKHMLDAPFYCRAGVEAVIEGERSIGVHEALDLRRFASPFLKPMLAVKVPRRRAWKFPER